MDSFDLLGFIEKSPTAYHAAENIARRLEDKGFDRLYAHEEWDIKPGGRYFAVRGGASVIAFIVPEVPYKGVMMCAAHTDSPSFRLKASPETAPVNGLVRLNVEGYGGMIKESWFDRPLSVAGRVAVATDTGIEYRNVDVGTDIAVIPSLAVHMGAAHDGGKINIQNEMLPVIRTDKACGLGSLIAKAAKTDEKNIAAYDLFLYNREKGRLFGTENEFIASPRLDDLQNVYAACEAFLASKESGMLKIFAAFNNEETGSLSRQGAESTFFSDVMTRVNAALGVSRAEYIRRLASGIMMSADNAHAMHPNYPSKADIINRPVMNGGVVIKYNASARYTTDSVSSAIVKTLCKRAGVPYQEYHNRSDIAGGSTLGNLMNRYISVYSADIGLAQLSMHSSFETAGAQDTGYMVKFLTEFYGTEIAADRGGLKLL